MSQLYIENVFQLRNDNGVLLATNGIVSAITGTSLQYIDGTGSAKVLNTSIVPELTNLYFTTARAQDAISGLAPISVSSGVVSITQANSTTNGYLSSTDWNTFNSKQNAITNPITGTGSIGQVAYWNGTNTQTGSNILKFDGTNLSIGNPSSVLANLHVYNSSAAASFLLQTNSTTNYSEIAVRNDSSTATSYFRQYSTATTGSDFGISRAGLALFFSNFATNFAIGTRNGGSLIFGTADTERARFLASNGYFGLNTTNPIFLLDVNGTARITGQLTLGSTITNGTYTYTLPSATGTLALNSSLGSYVPYTGATSDLNLGTHNFYGNNYFDGFTSVAASGTQIVLTINSTPSYLITGSGGQTIKLPDATTLPNGAIYSFNNNQTTGAISVNNNSNTLVKSVSSGAYLTLVLIDNTNAAGSWDAHFQSPSNASWSTNTFDYSGSFTSGTWNGNVIAINRGGTGASTAAGALSNLGGIGLTSLSASSPLSYNNTTGAFSISQATTSTNGYLSSTDWNTFNNKQATLSLTTTGSSGSSTLVGSTLNVPTYTLSGLGGVPTSRTLTINGTAYDLSADRSWSVGTVTSVAALSLGTSGTDLNSSVATGTTTPVITLNVPTASASNRGALSSADWSTFNGKESVLTFSSPLVRTTNTISIPVATTSVNGYLSSTDWTTFNNKQGAITLTTTGTSGAATLVGNTLNIPQYSGGGSMAIGGSITSATAGSILYAGASGVLAQDNANLYYDYTNARLGIGINAPNHGLTYNSGLTYTAFGLYNSYSGSGSSGNRNWTLSTNDQVFGDFAIRVSTALGGNPITAGSIRAYIDASGRFGIGTTTIGSTLQVNGNAAIGYSASTAAPTNGLAVAGNVGIGTSSPSRLLSLGGTAYVEMVLKSTSASGVAGGGTIYFGNSSTDSSGILNYELSGNYMNFFTAGSERMRITSGGNVGIGTSSPTAKLTVLGSNSIGSSIPSSWASIYSGRVGVVNGNNSFYFDLNPAPYAELSTYNYSTSATFPLVLQGNGGNVLIGTTTDGGGKLQVIGSTTAATGVAKGINFTPTLVAAANSDVLSGLYINPTFTNGAFTGVTNWALNAVGNAIFNGNVVVINPTSGLSYSLFRRNGTDYGSIGIAAAAGDLITNSAANDYCIRANSGKLNFSANNGATLQMTLTTSGTLGLGTTTVGSTLQVNGNAAIGYSSSTAAPTNGLAVAGSINVTATSGALFYAQSATTSSVYSYIKNTSGTFYWGTESSVGGGIITGSTAYYGVISCTGLQISANNGTNVHVTINSTGNFMIGTTTDVASAKLQVASTTQGFLPPVMTTTQKNAISSPATGLVVFDTTLGKLCVYSTTWQTITSV